MESDEIVETAVMVGTALCANAVKSIRSVSFDLDGVHIQLRFSVRDESELTMDAIDDCVGDLEAYGLHEIEVEIKPENAPLLPFVVLQFLNT